MKIIRYCITMEDNFLASWRTFSNFLSSHTTVKQGLILLLLHEMDMRHDYLALVPLDVDDGDGGGGTEELVHRHPDTGQHVAGLQVRDHLQSGTIGEAITAPPTWL